jgi:uncharacterized membrane protein YeiB
MAGRHSASTSGAAKASARAYTPTSSQEWHLMGFAEYNSRMTQGLQDVRIPVVSNQIPRVPIVTFAGMQLRQPLSLLTQKYNISFADHTYKEWQPQAVQLATHRVSTGLGIGTLKNLNVKANGTVSNLRARASRFGRLSAQIPAA